MEEERKTYSSTLKGHQERNSKCTSGQDFLSSASRAKDAAARRRRSRETWAAYEYLGRAWAEFGGQRAIGTSRSVVTPE